MVARHRLALLSVLLSILLLGLAAQAHALAVERMWAEWHGHPVKTIAPGKVLPGAVLKVQLSGDLSACSSTCQLRMANPLDVNGAPVAFDIKGCEQNDTAITCTSEPFDLSTKTESNVLKYSLWINGVSTPGQSTIKVLLDSTTPSVASIKTGYCDETACYASNGDTPVTVAFSDTITSFDYKLVYVGGSRVLPVNSCTGKTCTGTVNLPCSRDGEEYTLRIASMDGAASREDAFNEVTGGATQKVICSIKAPAFLSGPQMSADGIAGQAVGGGSLTFTARVQSLGAPDGALNGTISNGTDTFNVSAAASCAPDGETADTYLCTWTLSQLPAGKANLRLYLSDAIGNAPAPKSYPFTILNLKTPPKAAAAYFSAAPTAVVPERLNRMALELARTNYLPYPTYVTYSITRKNPQARIVKQELKQCWYKLPGETNYTAQYNLFSFGGSPVESRVLYPNQDWDRQNRLNLQIRADPEVLKKSDTFNALCQIDLTVAEGNNIYAAPQPVNISFTIGLRESALGEPGSAFVDKIKRTETDLNSGSAKTIRSMESAMETLQTACKGIDGIVMAEQLYSSIQVAGGSMCNNPVTAIPGQAMATKGEVGSRVLKNGIMGKLWYGNIGFRADSAVGKALSTAAPNNALVGQGGPLRMLCRQVNCRTYSDLNNSRAPSGSVIGGNTPWENTLNSQTARRDYQATVIQNRALLAGTGSNANTGSVASTKSNDAAPTGSKYGKAVGEQMLSSVFKDANVANPNTLVGAMSTACFGGVVFSLQKKQAIDCSYLQCLKEQSSTGSSVAVCDLSRGYAVCMNVMGEAGEFPLVRTFKNIAANVNAIIQNWPSYVAKSLLDVRCLPAQVSPPPFPCTDWYRIGCRVQESFFSVSDAARQTTQAFGGIRDDEGKRYREMCTAAINYKPGTRTQASQALSSGQQALGQFAPNYAQALNALPKLMAMGRDIDARKAANVPLSSPMGVISSAWSKEYASDMASGNKGVKTVPAITGITRVTDIRASGGKPALQIVTIQTTDGERRIEVPAGTIPSDKVALFTDGNFIALQKAGYGDAALYMTTEQLNRYGSAFVKAGQATDLLAGSAEAKTAMQRYFACADDTCRKEALAKVPKEYTITQTTNGLSITAPVANPYQTCKPSECICGSGGCNVQFRTVDDIKHDLSLTSEQVTALEKYKAAYPGSEDTSGLLAVGLNIDPKTNAVYKTGTVSITKEQYTLALSRNNARVAQARAELVGKFSDYAAQWMYQKGYLNFMTLSGMGINFRTLDPEEWKRSACSDIADINDNEEGTIIDFGDSPVLAKPVASFGSEIRALDNGSTRQYAYITAVHVYNAERNHTPFDRRSFNYTMEVVLTGLKSCAGSCPNELSLTNGGVFKLDEGVTFGNGNAPKTRIDYLPGEYQKICLRFDHKFPDPVTGNTIYCRTIKETVFNTGSPQPPPTSEVDRFGYTVNSAGTGSAGANGPAPIDPLRGWS